MELMVSPLVFISDVILLLVIGYAAFYALRRINRYEEPLNRFLVVTAFSLLLASIGRLMDVADDFAANPESFALLEGALYFFSIVGVTYGIINYIRSVERRIFPLSSGEIRDGNLPPGGFLYLGERDEIFEFLGSCKIPALVVTRSPWKYKEFCDSAQTLWITQASGSGVGPTKLHVILDSAVKFLQSGGRLVVIDCLEVLILYNDFHSVFRFLSTLRDYAVEAGSTVLLIVDQSTVGDRELMMLKREFAPVKDLKELLRTSS